MYEARIHTSIAKCHQSLGRYDDTIAHYERALTLQRRLCVGREELLVGQTLDEMAYTCGVRGDYAAAAARLRESLAIKHKVLEPSDLKLAKTKVDLAAQLKYLCVGAGASADSGALLAEALELVASARTTYESAVGEADPLTAQAAALQGELVAASRTATELSLAVSPRGVTPRMSSTPRSGGAGTERRMKQSPRSGPETPSRAGSSPQTPPGGSGLQRTPSVGSCPPRTLSSAGARPRPPLGNFAPQQPPVPNTGPSPTI